MDLQAKVQRGGTFRLRTGLPELAEREQMLDREAEVPARSRPEGERGDEDRFGYRLPGGRALLGRDEKT